MRWTCPSLNKLLVFVLLLCGLAGCDREAIPVADAAQYDFTLETGLLRMKDGVQLSVTYYRPTAKTPDETFPVLMEMVPYRKDDFFALGDYEYGAYFARRGYVVARVDVRGTGGSEGPVPVSEYSEAEISDAVQLIDQFSKMPWSNGKVGMYGISWSAFNALMTAHRKPPALKGIIAAHGSSDLYYNDVHYIDGALHIDTYAHQIDTDNAMPQSPDYRIDDTYFKNRFDREPWLFTWMREQQDSTFWRKESVQHKGPLEVPAYLIGGLLDGYRDFVTHVSQNATAPVIAEIGPWNHAWPEYGTPGPNYEWRQKALRWWDHWLKGADNGILDEPRRMAFMRTGHPPATDLDTIPGYWRCDTQWPVDGSHIRRLYPQAGKQLGETVAQQTTDSLRYLAGTGMAAGGWWGEQTGDMAADDVNSLVYDSAPLTEAVDIMGIPQVRLRVVADAPLYQWTVRLEDVAPDGKVSLVSGGIINPSQRESRLHPKALVPGEATTLNATTRYTTWRFKPGHRIRLAVANAQFPMIWPTPTAGTTQLLIGANTWIALPQIPVQETSPVSCELPPPDTNEPAPFGKELDKTDPVFRSERNDETGDSTFTTGSDTSWTIDDNTFKSSESYKWHVNDAAPANARYEAERRNIFTIKGDEIDMVARAMIQSDATHFNVTFTRILHKNGTLVREKTWTERIPRKYQ